jgi:hypothetical protein
MRSLRSRPAATTVLAMLASSATLLAQTAPQHAVAAPTLQRFEVTDPATGVHSVRLLLSLPAAAGASQPQPPRFTVECIDNKGKHDMLWSVSFGGVPDPGFVPPFRRTQDNLFPPQYPSVTLKMTFEGYIKSKPFTGSWSVMPWGELRYRNPGTLSPNMDSTPYFLTFLSSLPGLRIVHAKPAQGDPGEIFFPTQPLLDELKKTPVCSP